MPEDRVPAESPRPTISIVTPSYNQAAYLRSALDSVLNQQGLGTEFDLDYVVMDGGSTDGAAEIVQEYADRLSDWVSEPDDGHYAAINAGFEKTSGDIMGWLNSDDMYCPWALRTVAGIFAQNPDVAWLTAGQPILWARDGCCAWVSTPLYFSTASLLDAAHINDGAFPFLGFLQQESTFWRRELWDALCTERAAEEPDAPPGALRPRFSLAGDHDLWLRFAAHAEPATSKVPLGGFRKQPDQRSGQMDRYLDQAKQAVAEARATAGLPPRNAPQKPFPRWQDYARRLGMGPLAIKGRYQGRVYKVEDAGAERTRWVPQTVAFP